MKKHVNRLLTGGLIAALLILFASCQKDTPAGGTTAPSEEVSAYPVQENTSQLPSVLQTVDTTFAKGGATTSKKPSDSNKSLSASDIVNLYNQSVRQARRTSFSRTMNTGKLWLSNNSDKSFDLAGDANVRKIFDCKESGKTADTLPMLTMANIESAKCKESGGKRVLTIRLKPVTAGKDVGQQAAFYPGLLGYDESVTMVKDIGKVFKLSGISVKNITYTLNNGLVTATLSAAGNKLNSATLSYQQGMDMNLKFIAFQIQGKLTSEVKASYSL